LNKLLILTLAAVTFSLFSILSLGNAEIKFIPPPKWEPNPYNNSTAMQWYQNSTGSSFMLFKSSEATELPLFFVAPLFAEFMAEKGVLESVDQITFGRSNYGYRYILNISSPSELLNSTSALINMQPSNFAPVTTIPKSQDVPIKVMVILTQKHNEAYTIQVLTPSELFEPILNELKPTIDSIEVINSSAMGN
jgi:hypothetical protein